MEIGETAFTRASLLATSEAPVLLSHDVSVAHTPGGCGIAASALCGNI